MKKRLRDIALVLFAFVLAMPAAVAQEDRRPFTKGLVLIISVDQMKAEFYDWYGQHWTGGLKRIFEEGIVYTKASLDYSASETGPGHATLSTGSFPKVHGIVGNEWVDPVTRKEVYCVEDPGAGKVDEKGGGMSPGNLLVTGLGDWLKEAHPSAKVVSLSVKDRAAVLMGGQKPNQVYWYDRTSGHLVTSDYYMKESSSWMREFNAGNWVFKNVPPVWNKLLDSAAYVGPDEMKGESESGGSTTFPRRFNLARRAEQMTTSPWGDALILDAGKAAILGEKLGTRGVPDMLALGLSCTDYVGHAYGPNSHEMQDHLARLDVALGAFLADVETIVGKGNILLALSADHACLPLPEYTVAVEHRFARRLNPTTEITPNVNDFHDRLREELGTEDTLILKDRFLNYEAAAKHGLSADAFETRVRAGLTAIDGIADVFFKREFASGKVPPRLFADRFANSMHLPRMEDFHIRYCEGCLPSSRSTGTSHGSCYDYDNSVPVVFWGQPYTTNKISTPVRTVDVAPTIARKVGATPPKSVSGAPLKEVFENIR